MGKTPESESTTAKHETTLERASEREIAVTRRFDAPARILFEAWSKPELFKQWWVPKSYGLSLLSCEMDVRIGGNYRLEFGHPDADQPMAFFGSYIDVIANARIVWTNEESDEGPVTSVTFEEQGGQTLLTVHNRYPSKEALDNDGSMSGMRETLDQLDELIGTGLKP